MSFKSSLKIFFGRLKNKLSRNKLTPQDLEKAEKSILDQEVKTVADAKRIIENKNKELDLKKRELKAEQRKNIVLRKIKARKERQVPKTVFQQEKQIKGKPRFFKKKTVYELSITFSWFVRYVQRGGNRDDSPESEGSSGPQTEVYRINADNNNIARQKALNVLRQKHNEITADLLLHNNKSERIISIDATVFNAQLFKLVGKEEIKIDELDQKLPYVQPQL